MPNEHGEYAEEETRRYQAEECSWYHKPKSVEWATSNPGKEPPLYVPGLETCLNPECPRSPD